MYSSSDNEEKKGEELEEEEEDSRREFQKRPTAACQAAPPGSSDRTADKKNQRELSLRRPDCPLTVWRLDVLCIFLWVILIFPCPFCFGAAVKRMATREWVGAEGAGARSENNSAAGGSKDIQSREFPVLFSLGAYYLTLPCACSDYRLEMTFCASGGAYCCHSSCCRLGKRTLEGSAKKDMVEQNLAQPMLQQKHSGGVGQAEKQRKKGTPPTLNSPRGKLILSARGKIAFSGLL